MRTGFKLLFVFLFLCSGIALHSDESEDIILSAKSNSQNDEKKKNDYYMKFRGSLTLGFIYYFGVAKGISTGKNVSDVNYKLYDYTNDGDPDNRHHNDNIGYELGKSWGGVELGLYANYSLIAPFLTNDNFLFKGNNIKFTLRGELTPVSLNAGMDVTITPIAFLQFQSGFLIGSGWNFAGLFNGLGRNDGKVVKGKVEPFHGAIFQTWFSSTLQFDFSYIMPKKIQRWTHIVFQVTPKIKYEGLLNVPDTQPYQFEADEGENLNGWILMGSYLFGYQIPIIEDDTGKDNVTLKRKNNNLSITIAMLFVIDRMHLTHHELSPMKKKGWGSDFCYVYFGPIINLDLPNNMNAILGFQWANEKEYTSQTVGNIYYQNRVYKNWYVYFCRVIVAVGWNF